MAESDAALHIGTVGRSFVGAVFRLRKYIAGSCLIRHRGRYKHSCRDGLKNQYEQ